MTAIAVEASVVDRRRRWLRLDSIPIVTAIATPLLLLLSWRLAVEVWDTGRFVDTDDAMRMVQVRDWLAGQGFFDLVAHRLGPAGTGTLMHWSRVVDVPLAVLMGLFGRVLDPQHAERLARIAFPVALQVAMVPATAWGARILAGRDAVLPAALLVVLSGIVFGQFQPGRIDHHAPQILLLMLATGTTLAALAPGRGRLASLTGLVMAVSLAISLENLPFFAVLLMVPSLAWLRSGPAARQGLSGLAGGLGLGLPIVTLATVAPARLLVPMSDALSIALVAALELGVAGLFVLALLSSRLPGLGARLLAAAVVGVVVATLVAAFDPAVLHGPYAVMDPLLERLWLDKVQEAQPFLRVLRADPASVLPSAGPLLVGTIAALVAATRGRGLARARWLVVLGVLAVGWAGACWEVRVFSSAVPLALLPGAWAASRAIVASRNARPLVQVRNLVLILPFSAMAWAAVPWPERPGAEARAAGAAACHDPAALAPLAELPDALALAPIDAGSYLLAYTRMAAVAAPYHRDRAGNLASLEIFRATPGDARAIAEAAGATRILTCAGDVQLADAAAEKPDGLAAALAAGRVPDWLALVPVAGTPYRVFEIRR